MWQAELLSALFNARTGRLSTTRITRSRESALERQQITNMYGAEIICSIMNEPWLQLKAL
jgi:hypothetical protein